MVIKILVVDDEPEIVSTIRRYLAYSTDYEVVGAASVAEAMTVFADDPPPVVLSDINMPGETGIDMLAKMKSKSPAVQFLIMTGQTTLEKALDAMEKGAADYLLKPLDLALLERLVKEAVERHHRWYEVVKINLSKKRGKAA